MNVGIVANGRRAWSRSLKTDLLAEASALELDVSVHERDRTLGRDDDLLVYFGNERNERSGVSGFATRVLPVLEKAEVATEHLPEELRPLNAFLCDKHGCWETALVDEVLSRLWIGRIRRKTFISYKRTDSEEIADQLHASFVKLGGDVFLDRCSIDHGEEFQPELRYWLNDTDLVLLLASPNFTESAYVLEEIEFALSSQIGLLAVLWPGLESKAQRRRTKVGQVLSRIPSGLRMQLKKAEFENDKLTAAAVERIKHRALAARANSLMRRLRHLLPLARDVLNSKGKNVQKAERVGDLVVTGKGDSELVRVFPFRPDVGHFHRLWQEAKGETDSVACFYDENDPHADPVAAMRWAMDAEGRNEPKQRRLMPFDARAKRQAHP